MLRTPSVGNALALAVALSFLTPTALPQWKHQSPRPTVQDLHGVEVLSAHELWIAGDEGTLLHSTDGGRTFVDRSLGREQFWDVVFVTDQIGYVYGNATFRTTDGGTNWQKLNTRWGSIAKMFFLNEQIGWAAENATLWRTTDGGVRWTSSSLPDHWVVHALHFVDDQHGFAANIDGKVYESTDGGATWAERYDAGSATNLSEMGFVDSLQGWILGGETVLETRDGGQHWSQWNTPKGVWAAAASFVDADHHFSAGAGGNIAATDDAWRSTSLQRPGNGDPNLWDVDFADLSHGYCVGESGTILATEDGGRNWVQRHFGFAVQVHQVWANDAAHAWAAHERGQMSYTADGGRTWQHRRVEGIGPFGRVSGVEFVDNLVGWAVGADTDFGGDTAVVARTVDGGRTWTQQYRSAGGFHFDALAVFDERTMVAAGKSFNLDLWIRTDDGGRTWTEVTPPTAGSIFCGDTVSDSMGWLAGGRIWKTTDAGRTWSEQDNPPEVALDISFADRKVGFLVGIYGFLWRTTNGGQTWNDLQDPLIGLDSMFAVDVVDDQNLWISAYDDVGRGEPRLYRSVDGGASFTREKIGTNSLNRFNSLHFLDPENGWLGGSTIPPRGGLWRRTGPPLEPTLLHDRLLTGTHVDFEVVALEPSVEWALFYFGAGGISGCLQSQGPCFDLHSPFSLFGLRRANAAGEAQIGVDVPANLPFVDVHFQALLVGGSKGTRFTNSTTAALEF